MFNYDFKKEEEKAVFESRNEIVEINDIEYNLCMIITEKNVLLFKDLNQNHVLNSRGVQIPAEYDLFLKIPLKNIKYVIEEGNTYIDFGKDNVVIYNFDLEKCLD